MDTFELPYPELYSKPILEHIAGSGAYGVLDIESAWTPSLADGGVIAPIDELIDRFMNIAGSRRHYLSDRIGAVMPVKMHA